MKTSFESFVCSLTLNHPDSVFTSKIKPNKQIPIEYLMQMMPKKKLLYFHFSNFLTRNSDLVGFLLLLFCEPFTIYTLYIQLYVDDEEKKRIKYGSVFDVPLILPL